MIAPTQIQKPKNWQDFELLCKKLWGEIWNCSDSIKQNGRSGHKQCGVDVSGQPKGEVAYYGIQCKGKDDYIKSKLTKKEVDEEISKALNFKPKLKKLIFATTADKEPVIEEYIREKNIEHITNGLFEIDISSWDDIVYLLMEHRNTYNWYVNNCQYNDVTDFEVFVDWQKECKISPQYIHTTNIYRRKEEIDPLKNPYYALTQQLNFDLLSKSLNLNIGTRQRREVDYRWCDISINLKNVGNTVIEDYKLYLIFDSEKIEALDDKYRSFNPGVMYDQAAVAQENIYRRSQREVFESSEYNNVIEFKPLNAIIVQGEPPRTFEIRIKPKDNVDEISIIWIVKARDYEKEGTLILKVEPLYENEVKYIDVDNDNELKENEIIITPKIIER